MFIGKNIRLVLLQSLLLLPSVVFSQHLQDTISNGTPFRKGRWVTGLSGSISSGSNSLQTSVSGMSRNQYSFEFRTGRFTKDRLLIGALLSMSSDNTEEFQYRKSEKLFAGPLISWYMAGDEHGSLFISTAAVVTKFREEFSELQSDSSAQVFIDGIGGGLLLRIGYSYVLHDRVAFDLSVNYSNSWLKANVTEQLYSKKKENFNVGELSFSFGFSVILDDFFF